MSHVHPPEVEDLSLKEAARHWAQIRGVAAPTESDVAVLLRRARQRDGAHRPWRTGLVIAAVCASVVAVIGGLALKARFSDPPLSIVVADGQSRSVGRVVGHDGLDVASAESPLVVEAGDDRIAIDRATRVHLLKATRRGTRLALASGRILVHVKPRAKHTFEIDAGGHAIRVLGTRFSVSRPGPDELEVAVAHGVVQVDGPDGARIQAGETWRLTSAGAARSPLPAQGQQDIDALAFPAPTKAPAELPAHEETPAPPSDEEEPVAHAARHGAPTPLAHWQGLVASGRYEEARHGLETYVAKHSRDVEAWSLLADCRRKTGQASAVAAYRTVIALGDRAAKNRARLLAASFLQDQLHDQAAAVELLRAYLAAEPKFQPLRGSAMVRLARSLCATGQSVEAQGLLHKVMQELPGTTEANQANAIIEGKTCR